MSRVEVADVAVLREFRGRFLRLGEEMSLAASAGLADVQKTAEWLRGERAASWKKVLREREERLSRAREELRRALAAVRDVQGQAIRERRAVDAAEAAVREARERLEKAKRWSEELLRLGENLLLPCRRLKNHLDEALPKAAARLDAASAGLEAYAGLAPAPRGPSEPSPGPPPAPEAGP